MFLAIVCSAKGRGLFVWRVWGEQKNEKEEQAAAASSAVEHTVRYCVFVGAANWQTMAAQALPAHTQASKDPLKNTCSHIVIKFVDGYRCAKYTLRITMGSKGAHVRAWLNLLDCLGWRLRLHGSCSSAARSICRQEPRHRHKHSRRRRWRQQQRQFLAVSLSSVWLISRCTRPSAQTHSSIRWTFSHFFLSCCLQK